MNAGEYRRAHGDRGRAGRPMPAGIRPPRAEDLAICRACGCTTVTPGGFGPRDPVVVERLAIWEHFGKHHVFAPVPDPWKPGHNCVPGGAPR